MRGVKLAIGRAFMVGIMLFGMSLQAMADTVHRLRFAQPETLMVWQADRQIGQGAHVIVSPNKGSAPAEFMGSGQLLPLSMDEHAAEQKIKLSIASNTGFAIKIDDPVVADSARAQLVGMGANAAPNVAMPNPPAGIVFVQSEKTAQRPGSAESQALEIELAWNSDLPPAIEIIALAP